jgi:hypothetical protein
MTLTFAITKGLITPATLDGSSVWICANCAQYLVYYLAKYHFVCHCNDHLLKGE